MSNHYSVVIPAYNAAATIGEAVESAQAQTIPPTEIFVVDDGSTDETAAIVSAMPGSVRLIRRPNGGPGAATTQGMRAATTPLLATLDSDDLWLPQKIERQLDYLATHPDVTAVFTLAQHFEGNPADHARGRVQRMWSRLTLLIPTAAALAVGEIIDPSGGRGDMVDWLARCREMGHRFGIVEEVLALRRIWPGSMSYGRDDSRDAGYLHVARRAIERKRQLLAQAQGVAE